MIKIISDALSGKRPPSAQSTAIDSAPMPSSLSKNKPPDRITQPSREGKPDRSLQQALAAAENVWSQPTKEAGTSMSDEQSLNDKVTDAPQDIPKAPPKDIGEMGTPLPRAVEQIASETSGEKTQLVRGLQSMTRSEFKADPVVGWFVVIGGPGLGAFRPIFEGNNTIGRSNTQRVPIDFGDDAISAEEQCYIRYDSSERRFLFVPNLAKTNVVSVNDEKPTGAVALQAMDVITVGRTQLVFVPFCGDEFDWSELSDLKSD